jgi:hypothetical protein
MVFPFASWSSLTSIVGCALVGAVYIAVLGWLLFHGYWEDDE